jgi:peptide chain release factor 3
VHTQQALNTFIFSKLHFAPYSNNTEKEEFKKIKQKFLANDKDGQLVFLADSSFSLEMTKQKYPSIKFYNTSEFG